MTVIFKKDCSMIIESVALLTRYYCEEDFDALNELLKRKSGYHQEVGPILHVLQGIYERITKTIQKDDELAYLFKPIYSMETSFNLAQCIVLSVDELNGDVHECCEMAKRVFREDHGYHFMENMKNGLVEEGVAKTISMNQFMQFIETSEMAEDMKWHALRVYMNYEETIDKLETLLSSIESNLVKEYASNQHHFINFYEFWEKTCVEGRFIEAMKNVSNLQLDEKNKMTVRASWMQCNGISIHAFGLSEKENIKVFIGLFFTDKDFFLKMDELNTEDLCNSLKLMSDPSKYEILNYIRNEARYGLQLAKHLGLTTATISHHVNALVNEGLVIMTKESNRIYYRLNKDQLNNVIEQLKQNLMG